MTEHDFIRRILSSEVDYDIITVICECFSIEELDKAINFDFDLDDLLTDLINNRLCDTVYDCLVDYGEFTNIYSLSFNFDSFRDTVLEEEIIPNDVLERVIDEITELFEELNEWK